mgnify:CR=1 FL=1
MLKNRYILREKVSSGFCKDGTEFIFDTEDFEKINGYCWRMGSEGYIQTSVNGKTKLLHRIIMNASKEILVDHKHGIKTDNRKSELRFANKHQNGQNHKVYSSNTSGVTGVHFHKETNKFMARIKVNGKYKYLGLYENIEDAIKARLEAEKIYFGEFSRIIE